MARLIAVAMLLVAVAASASAFNVFNIGGDPSANTFVPGGVYQANDTCRLGSLVGRVSVLFLQEPDVKVVVTGAIHTVDANNKSQVTAFTVDGTWARLDQGETNIFDISNGSAAFSFSAAGVAFSAVYTGMDGNSSNVFYTSENNCDQELYMSNNFPQTQNWGSADNSSQDVADNFFRGEFRGPEQHLLVNTISILQNKKGLVTVSGEVLVPSDDYTSVNVRAFDVPDEAVTITVIFSPSATQYTLELNLNLDEDEETIDSTYTLVFYTPNKGSNNDIGTESTLTIDSEPEVVVEQPWILVSQSDVSIVDATEGSSGADAESRRRRRRRRRRRADRRRRRNNTTTAPPTTV